MRDIVYVFDELTVEISFLKFWPVIKCQDVRPLFLIHLLSDPELLVLVSHEVCQDCPSQEHHVLSPRRIFYPDFNPVKLLYLRPCTEGFSFLWMIKKNLGYMHSKVIKTSLQNFPSLSSRTRNTESLGSGLVSVSESASIFEGIRDLSRTRNRTLHNVRLEIGLGIGTDILRSLGIGLDIK